MPALSSINASQLNCVLNTVAATRAQRSDVPTAASNPERVTGRPSSTPGLAQDALMRRGVEYLNKVAALKGGARGDFDPTSGTRLFNHASALGAALAGADALDADAVGGRNSAAYKGLEKAVMKVIQRSYAGATGDFDSTIRGSEKLSSALTQAEKALERYVKEVGPQAFAQQQFAEVILPSVIKRVEANFPTLFADGQWAGADAFDVNAFLQSVNTRGSLEVMARGIGQGGLPLMSAVLEGLKLPDYVLDQAPSAGPQGSSDANPDGPAAPGYGLGPEADGATDRPAGSVHNAPVTVTVTGQDSHHSCDNAAMKDAIAALDRSNARWYQIADKLLDSAISMRANFRGVRNVSSHTDMQADHGLGVDGADDDAEMAKLLGDFRSTGAGEVIDRGVGEHQLTYQVNATRPYEVNTGVRSSSDEGTQGDSARVGAHASAVLDTPPLDLRTAAIAALAQYQDKSQTHTTAPEHSQGGSSPATFIHEGNGAGAAHEWQLLPPPDGFGNELRSSGLERDTQTDVGAPQKGPGDRTMNTYDAFGLRGVDARHGAQVTELGTAIHRALEDEGLAANVATPGHGGFGGPARLDSDVRLRNLAGTVRAASGLPGDASLAEELNLAIGRLRPAQDRFDGLSTAPAHGLAPHDLGSPTRFAGAIEALEQRLERKRTSASGLEVADATHEADVKRAGLDSSGRELNLGRAEAAGTLAPGVQGVNGGPTTLRGEGLRGEAARKSEFLASRNGVSDSQHRNPGAEHGTQTDGGSLGASTAATAGKNPVQNASSQSIAGHVSSSQKALLDRTTNTEGNDKLQAPGAHHDAPSTDVGTMVDRSLGQQGFEAFGDAAAPGVRGGQSRGDTDLGLSDGRSSRAGNPVRNDRGAASVAPGEASLLEQLHLASGRLRPVQDRFDGQSAVTAHGSALYDEGTNAQRRAAFEALEQRLESKRASGNGVDLNRSTSDADVKRNTDHGSDGERSGLPGARTQRGADTVGGQGRAALTLSTSAASGFVGTLSPTASAVRAPAIGAGLVGPLSNTRRGSHSSAGSTPTSPAASPARAPFGVSTSVAAARAAQRGTSSIDVGDAQSAENVRRADRRDFNKPNANGQHVERLDLSGASAAGISGRPVAHEGHPIDANRQGGTTSPGVRVSDNSIFYPAHQAPFAGGIGGTVSAAMDPGAQRLGRAGSGVNSAGHGGQGLGAAQPLRSAASSPWVSSPNVLSTERYVETIEVRPPARLTLSTHALGSSSAPAAAGNANEVVLEQVTRRGPVVAERAQIVPSPLQFGITHSAASMQESSGAAPTGRPERQEAPFSLNESNVGIDEEIQAQRDAAIAALEVSLDSKRGARNESPITFGLKRTLPGSDAKRYGSGAMDRVGNGIGNGTRPTASSASMPPAARTADVSGLGTNRAGSASADAASLASDRKFAREAAQRASMSWVADQLSLAPGEHLQALFEPVERSADLVGEHIGENWYRMKDRPNRLLIQTQVGSRSIFHEKATISRN
jgi:hypothetical protein